MSEVLSEELREGCPALSGEKSRSLGGRADEEVLDVAIGRVVQIRRTDEGVVGLGEVAGEVGDVVDVPLDLHGRMGDRAAAVLLDGDERVGAFVGLGP